MGERRWGELAPAQADGLACVICGWDYLGQSRRRVPVGRSWTGAQVFACLGDLEDTGSDRVTGCAERAGVRLWPPLRIPDDALTAGGAAFLAAVERETALTPTGDTRHAYPDEVVAETVGAAAPLVVACELRRLAVRLGGDAGGYWVRRELADRADRLDPAGAE